MAAPSSVIVIGVGVRNGLGAALCRRFAAGGLHVWAAGRTEHRLAAICEEIEGDGGAATPVVTDTTLEADLLAGRGARGDESFVRSRFPSTKFAAAGFQAGPSSPNHRSGRPPGRPTGAS